MHDQHVQVPHRPPSDLVLIVVLLGHKRWVLLDHRELPSLVSAGGVGEDECGVGMDVLRFLCKVVESVKVPWEDLTT